ncbi:MAG: hypothetical protein WBC44_14245 [Planctomycetaceae bacterium]
MAGTLIAAGVGCSSSQSLVRSQPGDAVGVARAVDRHESSVIRAQSPDRRTAATPGPSHNTKFVSHEGVPVDSGMLADGTIVGAYEAGTFPGGSSPGVYSEGGYPPGYCPPGAEGYYGPMVNCDRRYPGGIRYTHTYEDPGVPVYPPGTGPALTGPGSPGAVVQYPYYTTKGPDDFFHDEDGRF